MGTTLNGRGGKTEAEERDEVRGEESSLIGEKSVVRLSLAIAVASGVVVFTYWCATLQADVRGVQRDLTTIRQAVAGLDKISSIENAINELNRFGSENSRKTANDLQELRKDFEMYKAMSARTQASK
jgi:hypothetical protein